MNKRQVYYNDNHKKQYNNYHGNNGSNKENNHHMFSKGDGNITDFQAQQQLKRMVKCNTLTICSSKSPEYYLKLIRYHFTQSNETLSLQALGLSCQNLIYVSCLVTLKGYANYKKIKNDHLSVPVADSRTGQHLGLLKKVRLTVKLTRSENFHKIIEQEKEHQAIIAQSQNYNSFSQDGNSGCNYSMSIQHIPEKEEEKFDQEDLILKTKEQIEQEAKNIVVNEKEAQHDDAIYRPFEDDPNFRIDEEEFEDDEEEIVHGEAEEEEEDEDMEAQEREEAQRALQLQLQSLDLNVNSNEFAILKIGDDQK